MKIYCCQCGHDVFAELTSGAEVYPHIPELSNNPYWICRGCSNSVGTHHKTKEKTKPLGVIANKEIKSARMHIHRLIDPLWKDGWIKRKELYSLMSQYLGWEYHTAELRNIEDCRKAYRAGMRIKRELQA